MTIRNEIAQEDVGRKLYSVKLKFARSARISTPTIEFSNHIMAIHTEGAVESAEALLIEEWPNAIILGVSSMPVLFR